MRRWSAGATPARSLFSIMLTLIVGLASPSPGTLGTDPDAGLRTPRTDVGRADRGAAVTASS